MLYNYLAFNSLSQWPKEKAVKLLSLLNISKEEDIDSLEVTGEYIIDVENRLNEGVKLSSNTKEVLADLKGFNKKEQEILSSIINLLKEKMANDKGKTTYQTYCYLYHFLQSMDSNQELLYILAYMSKSLGFTEPMDFIYDREQQFIFESIMFSAMTLYNNGGASKSRIKEIYISYISIVFLLIIITSYN